MKSISAVDAKRILDNDERVILLDVRSPEEYLRSRISCGINLPYDEIEAKVESILPDKNSKIIVYCLSGSRSVIAAETLEKLGYTDVTDLSHGLLGWRSNNFALE